MEVAFEKLTQEQTAEEYGILKGTVAGEERWIYQTKAFSITELEAVEWIATLSERVYVNEGGEVVAIDRATGEELWRNTDFGGRSIRYALDGEERLFLCGYYGPDFFEINADGETVKRIESFYEELMWPGAIAYKDGKVTVVMTAPEEGGTVVIDLSDYSYQRVD